MIEIVEFVDASGRSPFARWFSRLDAQAAAIITVALTRLGQGARSSLAPIGEGASELKIDRGPGFRIYLAFDGPTLVILLGGGTKRRQSADIAKALQNWRAYKERKV